jgi:hypothetical protein
VPYSCGIKYKSPLNFTISAVWGAESNCISRVTDAVCTLKAEEAISLANRIVALLFYYRLRPFSLCTIPAVSPVLEYGKCPQYHPHHALLPERNAPSPRMKASVARVMMIRLMYRKSESELRLQQPRNLVRSRPPPDAEKLVNYRNCPTCPWMYSARLAFL